MHNNTGTPEVSVVVPVYNGGPFIQSRLESLLAFLKPRYTCCEIIVVNDGSTDDTPERLAELHCDRLQILHLHDNLGKFAAIKAGMALARGRARLFIDADIPFRLEAIPYMVDLILSRGFHVVIGDRTLSESCYASEISLSRRVASRFFSGLVRLLVTGGLFDTQCGLKGFRADVAELLFPLLTLRGFAADVELLYIALKYNLEIKRVPVYYVPSQQSSIHLVSHSLKMFARIISLPAKWNRGLYESKPLRELSAQKYI